MKKILMIATLMCSGAMAVMYAPASAENPDHVQRLRDTRNCEGCDLSDAKLSGLNAQVGNLRNADLRRAVLYKATLRVADLTGALLSGANLSGADLSGARGANLAGAITDETTRCPSGEYGPC